MPDIFEEQPTLQTPRLQLRPLHNDDVDDIFELYRQPDVMAYNTEEPFQHRERAESHLEFFQWGYLRRRLVWWALCQTDSPRLIGMLGLYHISLETLTAETGFDLHPNHWGKGYMTEALRFVLQCGFDTLRLQQVDARTLPHNTRSMRLLRVLGFEDRGMLEPYSPKNDRGVPTRLFVLNREHFHGN